MKDKSLNPVLMKELKLRFRNAKSFSSIAFYLVALVLFVFAFFIIMSGFVGSGYLKPDQSFILFCCLTGLQMGLVLFMGPALTAGAISTEREKQTLNILLTTTQSSTQIIVGKLCSSIAFLVLILLATMPMYSLVFLFGGVSPQQLLAVFFFFIFTVFAMGSVGIMFSTIMKKTIVSMISTYGVVIFLTLFTFIFFIVSLSLSNGEGPMLSYVFLSLNPFAVVFSLLSPELGSAITEMSGITQPIWIIYLIFYSLMGLASLMLAIKKLRTGK